MNAQHYLLELHSLFVNAPSVIDKAYFLFHRRSRLGTGTSKKPTSEESKEKGKAYLAEKYRGQLLDKVSKDELRETCPVPAGVDTNEWLATNSKLQSSILFD